MREFPPGKLADREGFKNSGIEGLRDLRIPAYQTGGQAGIVEYPLIK